MATPNSIRSNDLGRTARQAAGRSAKAKKTKIHAAQPRNRPHGKQAVGESLKSKAKRPSKRDARKQRPIPERGRLTSSQEEAKLRGLAAINRVRKDLSPSLSAAARAEGTSVRAIRKLLPGALTKDKAKGRIRVKAGDTYAARVAIITASGPLVVTAHGSRERDLAGFHRSVVAKVLGKEEPASALRQFRGKKIGGQKLISDFDKLRELALAGVLGDLDKLYAHPEVPS